MEAEAHSGNHRLIIYSRKKEEIRIIQQFAIESGQIDLDTDQTLTPESSLPERRAAPS